MRIVLSLAAVAMMARLGTQADYLAWTVDNAAAGEYSYAKIYYADAIGNTGGSDALHNFRDNNGTAWISPDTQVSSAAFDNELTVFAQMPTTQTGYAFYVLLYNSSDKVLRYARVSDYDTVNNVVSDYSPFSGNMVNGAYATPLVASSFVAPEPSSGLLLLIGSAALLLRRKRKS